MSVHDVQSPPEIPAPGDCGRAEFLLRKLGVQSFQLCDAYGVTDLRAASQQRM